MREARSGRRRSAPTVCATVAASAWVALAALLALARPAGATAPEGYRGIPAFVQVTSVAITTTADVNRALVCYRMSTGAPALTLRADAAERFPRHSQARPRPRELTERGRPPRASVRRVVFDSTFQRVTPSQLTFFSSIPRSAPGGAPRLVTATSQRSARLEYPGFERVDFCETTEFEKALGPTFLTALFESPFMIGDLTGSVSFRLELVEETVAERPGPRPRGPHRGPQRGPQRAPDGACSPSAAPKGARGHARRGPPPCRQRVLDVLRLSPAQHVVPVFGKNTDLDAERLTLEAAATDNAALFMASGMPPELVAAESDAALDEALLTTFGLRRARPASSDDCRRFLGLLRDAAISRGSARPRPRAAPRSGTRRAALPARGER